MLLTISDENIFFKTQSTALSDGSLTQVWYVQNRPRICMIMSEILMYDNAIYAGLMHIDLFKENKKYKILQYTMDLQ